MLIASGGLAAITAIVFAETGLLVGFFLPGDSLLFLAGAMTAVNLLDPTLPPPLAFWPTVGALTIAAILGNSLNWWLGRKFGERLWSRPDGRLIKRRHLEQAQGFYDRYGPLALVLTRFVPIARTFTPFIAGAARMPFGRYTVWNIIGAVVWVLSLTAAGHWLGTLPFIQKNIELIVLAIVFISVAPLMVHGLIQWLRPVREDAGAGKDGRLPPSKSDTTPP